MSKPSDDGTGCIIIMMIVAFAIGAGCFWGVGVGFLVFGGILLALLVCA